MKHAERPYYILKERKRLIKEMLLVKVGYQVKECQIVTKKGIRRSQNFNFLVLKFFFTGSVFEEVQLTQISFSFKNSCCNFKTSRVGAKLYVAFLLF